MDEGVRITGFQVLHELAASVWRFRGRALGALALLLLATLATVAVPLPLKAIIDALRSTPISYCRASSAQRQGLGTRERRP